MGERSAASSVQPLLQPQNIFEQRLAGYDSLQKARISTQPENHYEGFSPNTNYGAYMNMHKVFVGRKGGRELINIATNLKDEWLPDYLNAGGWAAAEAGLVCDDLSTTDRINLLNIAESCWENALLNQSVLNQNRENELLCEDTNEFRIALNLAYAPIMKSIITGNVTTKIRERVFADTLAIAQTSAVQLVLASNEKNIDAVGDHLGFEHECNALLALLYVNDPNYVPIPSTFRAGSGYEYRNQTHDITIINQHWGKIHRFYPAEIKAAASLRDRQRYKALLVRGKMHLTLPGKYHPYQTTEAFAHCFNGSATQSEEETVLYTSTTIRDLLMLYQKGDCPEEFKKIRTQTKFHTTDVIAQKYKELSNERQ